MFHYFVAFRILFLNSIEKSSARLLLTWVTYFLKIKFLEDLLRSKALLAKKSVACLALPWPSAPSSATPTRCASRFVCKKNSKNRSQKCLCTVYYDLCAGKLLYVLMLFAINRFLSRNSTTILQDKCLNTHIWNSMETDQKTKIMTGPSLPEGWNVFHVLGWWPMIDVL